MEGNEELRATLEKLSNVIAEVEEHLSKRPIYDDDDIQAIWDLNKAREVRNELALRLAEQEKDHDEAG